MATIIQRVNNESDTPVAYLGTGAAPTGWVAWGFAPHQNHDGFLWIVEANQYHQALLTKAGVFYIWDKNYFILYQEAGSTEQKVLTEVHGLAPLIVLKVDSDGKPSATQL